MDLGEYEGDLENLQNENLEVNEKKKDFFDNDQWTLRKWCGKLLEKFSMHYRDKIF